MQDEEQTTEVKQTNEQVGNTNVQRETVRQANKPSTVIVAQQVIYYIGGVLIAILFLRLIFQLLGANQGSGFVDFIYGLSGVFVSPFFGIFGEPTFGNSHFETSTLIAIVIYALVTVGVAKLFALGRPHEEL
jgi:hypothetical protein